MSSITSTEVQASESGGSDSSSAAENETNIQEIPDRSRSTTDHINNAASAGSDVQQTQILRGVSYDPMGFTPKALEQFHNDLRSSFGILPRDIKTPQKKL